MVTSRTLMNTVSISSPACGQLFSRDPILKEVFYDHHVRVLFDEV